jgi:transposase InsO family protein
LLDIHRARAESSQLLHDGARGHESQRPMRTLEYAARRDACAIVIWAETRMIGPETCAALIGVDEATLHAWYAQHADRRDNHGAIPGPLGAKPLDCPPSVVARIRHHLALYGPGIGAANLKKEFLDVSWRDCQRLVRIFRDDLHANLTSCSAKVCVWSAVNTVWAADYAMPDYPIDGTHPWLLDVRDLASGCILASVPCELADTATAVAILAALVLAFGAPLVLKTDNGKHLIDGHIPAFLQAHGITPLLSPAYLPSYNGACESGHGSIKIRAEALARRNGTPGRWSCDHVEAARLWANRRTGDDRAVSAEQCFEGRGTITTEARERFLDSTENGLVNRRLEIAAALDSGGQCAVYAADSIDRHATVHTLVQHGFLAFQSRPVSQPIPFR